MSSVTGKAGPAGAEPEANGPIDVMAPDERRITLSLNRPSGTSLALIAILVVAALLRFTGLGWGGNLYLHPDERFQVMVVSGIAWPDSVGQYLDSATSPLNPYNRGFSTYIYGTVPLFLVKLAGTLTGMTVYGDAHLPGRALSSVCDLFSVWLLFLLGRRLFSAATGLVAAALMATTVLSIQTAHFFVPDAFVMVFCLAALYTAVRAQSTPRWRWFAATGLLIGLAVASKLTALPILMVLAIPIGEALRRSGWRGLIREGGARQVAPLPGVILAVAVTAGTFRLGQPYAFVAANPLDFRFDPRWLDDLRYWRLVQSGASDTPPNLQWADRTPVLFGLKNLVLWGMGPLLGVAAVAGLVWAVAVFARRRRCPPVWQLVLVGWPLFHLVYFGAGFVQTMRYLLPAYPALILLGAALLVEVATRGRQRGWPAWPIPGPRRWRVPLGAVPAIVVVLGTLLYAVAFTGLYTRPTTREDASRWIYANVPAGSVIATEHWDDGLPVSLPGEDLSVYEGFQLELFFVDDRGKLDALLDQLDRADYIVLSSDRLAGVIPRLPERYPMTSAYYRMLFSGDLGFESVARFTDAPSLFGVRIDDHTAEEAFTVYDHPRVMIFRKGPGYDRATVAAALESALGRGGLAIPLTDQAPGDLMLSETERVTQQTGGTWSGIFQPGGLANRLPVLVWYLTVQALALLAVPLCWRLFPALPDRGWAVAKTVGSLGTAWGAWMLASLRVLPFGPGAIALGALGIGGLSVAVCWRHRRSFRRWVLARWRTVAVAEALFLLVFLGVVWLRMQNPDLWHPDRGGEKPMEFALFNAVIRSTSFPPYDPWFADGSLNYYYFGYVIWGSLSRLTGIVPEVAFNLAVPTIAALLAINGWSVCLALLGRVARPLREPGREWPRWRLSVLALIAPVFVGVIGNLAVVLAVSRGEMGYRPSWLDAHLPGLFGIPALIGGLWGAVTQHPALPTDAYWAASRVIPGTINEFPAFSVLFADLHAHLMALPLSTLGLAVAVQLVLDPKRSRPGGRPASTGRDRALAIARPLALPTLAGFVTAALYATNTWDYPVAVVLLTGASLAGRGVLAGWRGWYLLLKDTALFALTMLVAGRLLFWPFFARFHASAGVMPTDERSTLAQYVTVQGVFLVAVAGLLAATLAPAWRRGRAVPVRLPARLSVSSAVTGVADRATIRLGIDLRRVPVPAGAVVILLATAVLAVAVLVGSLGLFLGVALILVAIAAWACRGDAGRLGLVAMVGAALGLSAFVERYAVAGDIGRMNTVFKLYLGIWLLLAIASATTIAAALASARRRDERTNRWRGIWAVALALVVGAGLVYPALATGPRLADRFNPLPPTLDGLAFMETATYVVRPDDRPETRLALASDLAAIEWLRANIAGSPVVLEAITPPYRWGSRISSTTGLPTVLGWDWHETQQRPGYGVLIEERRDDVAFMFGGGPFEAITPLLDAYHVRLIYVGELERATYGDALVATFEDAVAQGLLTVRYRADGVTIYGYGDQG